MLDYDGKTVTAMTNTTPDSCVEVRCSCNTMWSLAMQFSYLRLSDETGDFRAKLVADYAVRARRIAATYARYYLELEDGCEPDKKGRFYWMALGAFASKTVACTLETWQVRTQKRLSNKTSEGLGKGNFWLFCDISGWHWYYAKYNNSFDMCLESRNSDNFVPDVKRQVAELPWSAKALPKINKMQVSKYIKTGFEKVREFERETEPEDRRPIQFDHLMAIADHEQRIILQPLIYDDPDFAFWIRLQRSAWVNWAAPDLELVFSSACETGDENLSSVAPEGTKLEDVKSRMKWIGEAALRFHELMGRSPNNVERELQVIADWVGMADQP